MNTPMYLRVPSSSPEMANPRRKQDANPERTDSEAETPRRGREHPKKTNDGLLSYHRGAHGTSPYSALDKPRGRAQPCDKGVGMCLL
jgi:hypothetical protein